MLMGAQYFKYIQERTQGGKQKIVDNPPPVKHIIFLKNTLTDKCRYAETTTTTLLHLYRLQYE